MLTFQNCTCDSDLLNDNATEPCLQHFHTSNESQQQCTSMTGVDASICLGQKAVLDPNALHNTTHQPRQSILGKK